MRGRPRGHRFLAASVGAAGAVAAAGRVRARRRRAGPLDDELLGSLRGEPVVLRGPRASRLYAERFPGTRGTIILTHGWCLSEAVWHQQKAALAERGFTVVTWDLPGHGGSTAIARGRLTLDLAVDALHRVVQGFTDPNGIVLVGHSLGGVLTLDYLAHHPEAGAAGVRGAVFAATPLMHFARSIAGRWPGASVEARALGAAVQFVVSNPAIDRVFAAGVGDRDGGSLASRIVRVGFGSRPSEAHVRFIRDMIATVPPDVRVDTFRAMTGYDLSRDAAAVKVPALVVTGGRDRLVNPAESHLLAERLGRGTEVVFPNAGHAVFLEEHEAFNDEVARFAERRLRPPRLKAGAPAAAPARA